MAVQEVRSCMPYQATPPLGNIPYYSKIILNIHLLFQLYSQCQFFSMKIKENLETEEQLGWLRLCYITYLVNFNHCINFFHLGELRTLNRYLSIFLIECIKIPLKKSKKYFSYNE